MRPPGCLRSAQVLCGKPKVSCSCGSSRFWLVLPGSGKQGSAWAQQCKGTYRDRKDGKRVGKKLLFAAWRVNGTPTEIRER